MKDSSWRCNSTLLLAVWAALLAANFLSPPEFLKALTCPPRFVSMLVHARLDRLPWLGLALLAPAFAALWGWGLALMPWLGLNQRGFLLPFTLGTAVAASVINGLGLSGLYLAVPCCVIVVGGLVPALGGLRTSLPAGVLTGLVSRGWKVWLFDAVTAALLLVSLVDASCPEWFPDSLFYHFALPEQYLVEHRIFADPSVYSSANPQGYACMVGLLLPVGGWQAQKVFQWGVMVLAAFASGAVALELWGSRVSAALARALFASLPLVGQLAGHGQTDIPVALSVCVAARALLKWRRDAGSAWLVGAAVAMGAGMNCKFTAPLYWIALSLALPGGRMPLWKGALAWIAGSWLPVLPWLVRNVLTFYNPMAPLFAAYVPTFGWDATAERVQKTAMDLFGFADGMGRRIASLWLWSGTEQGPAGLNLLYGMGGLGILLPSAVFAGFLLGVPGCGRWLPLAILLIPAMWICVIQSFRYLFPLAGLCAGVLGGAGTGRSRGWLAGRLLAGLVLVHSLSLWTRILPLDPGPWLGGAVPVETPVVRSGEERGMLQWIRSLPRTARVMVLWSPAIYPSAHRIVYSGADAETPMLKWAGAVREPGRLRIRFKQAGVTHLAFNIAGGIGFGGGTWDRPWEPADQGRRIGVIDGFFRRYVRAVASRGEAVLYEVGWKGGAAIPEPLTGSMDRSMDPALIRVGEAMRAGRPEDAKAILRGLEPMAERSPYAAFRLGESWTALGEYAVALPLLRKATAAGYEIGIAYRAMALCLEKLGRPAEARKAEKRAVELDPTDPEEAFRVSLMNEGFCQPR